MRKLAYGLTWFFVFSVPWQAVVIVSGVGTISKLVGMIAFALGFGVVLSEARFRPPLAFHVAAACFVAWGSLSAFWTLNQELTTEWIWDGLQVLIAAWLIWELGSNPERHEGLMRAYVLGAGVAALNTLWNYQTGVAAHASSKSMQRFAATGFNPNDLAFLLAIALPMAWHFSVRETRFWVRWANRLYLPAGMLAVVLTGSRGGLIEAVFGCGLLLLWTLPRLSQRHRWAVVTLLFLCALVAVRYAPETSFERLATTRTELTEGTLNNRLQIWIAALNVVPRSPMLGAGAGTFKEAVLPVLGYEKTAHNSFLEVLVETGMLGLVLFLLLVLTAFTRAAKAPSRVRPLLLTILFTLLVGLSPREASLEKTTWVLLAFCLYPATAKMTSVRSEPSVAGSGQVWHPPVGATQTAGR